VDVRRTLGGPSPERTRPPIAAEQEALDRDRAWVDATRLHLHEAGATLREAVKHL